jgi:magnesium chelatase family protein
MLARCVSATVRGVEGFPITVEVDISPGLPSFGVVGLPDASVRESKERVTSAVRNSGFDFPLRRLTVNLAPADVRKEGPAFDLPMAVGLLRAAGHIVEFPEGIAYLGELSLDGMLRPVRGVLPSVLGLKEAGIRIVVVPEENGREAAIVDGISVYSFSTLREVVEFLAGTLKKEPLKQDREKLVQSARSHGYDLEDVKGQAFAKRAIEVAAAGGHNLLLIGPPGAGKTLLAKRVPTILPDLTFAEALEVTKIHSIAGTLNRRRALVATRPFRDPHHTISAVALVGGGTHPHPGEVSLAHRGVLFLDEFPEFYRSALEVLRQPLEDRRVHVSRVSSTVTFPSDFMLMAAMNPCPCGYLGHPERRCSCSLRQIQRYRSRVSGPLLDRIDIQVEVAALSLQEMTEEGLRGESSGRVRARVAGARRLQGERLSSEGLLCNSQMETTHVRRYCRLEQESKAFLRGAIISLGFSTRAYEKVLKVARTIADISGSDRILKEHLSEAVSYRVLDRSSILTHSIVAQGQP